MEKSNDSVLFLGKKDDPHTGNITSLLAQRFSKVDKFFGQWGDPLPDSIRDWQGEYIISYLSRWILPRSVIAQAKVAAINFHPAPPDYPGIGCNNFALYDGAEQYGTTCHHMDPKVDTGGTIRVRRFPVYESDTVESLLDRTYQHQYALFEEIIGLIAKGEMLPTCDESWARKPYTRKELNDLSIITWGMDEDEVARRIRATTFRTFKPMAKIAGSTFVLDKK